MVKNCDLGLENAALGLRPRAVFSRPRSQFFTIQTSQPANNIYLCGCIVKNYKNVFSQRRISLAKVLFKDHSLRFMFANILN